MTERHLLFLLVADVDYLGLAVASLLDLATGERFEAAAVTPLGAGVHLPDTVGGAPIRFDHLGVRLAMESAPSRVALDASARSLRGRRLEVAIVVEAPPGRDTLNVVVPFGGGRFPLTAKQVGMPARGAVHRDGVALDFSDAWACLDFGRGIWPHASAWCWAAASGRAGGCAVSLNLGGRWTDGTGATENGLWIDGRLHKLSDDLTFLRARPAAPADRDRRVAHPEPHAPGVVDLAFTPIQRRKVRFDVGLLPARASTGARGASRGRCAASWAWRWRWTGWWDGLMSWWRGGVGCGARWARRLVRRR